MIAAMTAAIEMGTVDLVRLPLVLVRCRSRLQSRQRDVAGTYVVFDTPAICTGGRGIGHVAQCLLADYLFSTTLANRVEA
jgi:hypothetical protein